ncbi:ABC transporter permease [Rubellimicrobium sp. CFH 75288]|uniref:ABC transporter permease n=1 Tax=Rubellimicrobium sp. CFH 75288 TaxID=2697034 RepID=UPI0014134D84|nr:ABC transporter permease [Rubellimicrobium sp. CFH 75288]NAZ36130.1 ABC transporter permease [Rubellimicrobium sp. CFH 75288]
MADMAINPGAAAPRGRRAWPTELNALIGLVAIALVFEALAWAIRGQTFLGNTAILRIMILQVAVVGIIAIGVTQVIITGGIDLSSGSLVGMVGIIAMSFAQAGTRNGADFTGAVFWEQGWVDLPVAVPIAVGLVLGLIAGVVNGALVAYAKIPPFIATLGMMVTARGVAKWWTAGEAVSNPTPSFAALGQGMMPVLIFVALAVLFQALLSFTLYGTRTYAIGSNRDAARMSGINVERHLVLVYALAGSLAAVAGLIAVSRQLTAQAGLGVMYELDAIAMAVIGGVSLVGGRGSIIGTALGMLIFGIIISGFTFLRVDAYYQEMIKGGIIVGAVALDVWRQRRRALRG